LRAGFFFVALFVATTRRADFFDAAGFRACFALAFAFVTFAGFADFFAFACLALLAFFFVAMAWEDTPGATPRGAHLLRITSQRTPRTQPVRPAAASGARWAP